MRELMNGESQLVIVMHESINGKSQSVNVMRESLNGRCKSANVMRESVNGASKFMNVMHQFRIVKPLKIKKDNLGNLSLGAEVSLQNKPLLKNLLIAVASGIPRLTENTKVSQFGVVS